MTTVKETSSIAEKLVLFGTENRQLAKRILIHEHLWGNLAQIAIGFVLATDSRFFGAGIAIICISFVCLILTVAKAMGLYQAYEEIIMKFGSLAFFSSQIFGRLMLIFLVVGSALIRRARSNDDFETKEHMIGVVLTAIGASGYYVTCCCSASMFLSAQKQFSIEVPTEE